MDAWTATDVETVISTLQSVEVAVWAVREVAVGILVVAAIWIGWAIGGVITPSGKDMAWDGR